MDDLFQQFHESQAEEQARTEEKDAKIKELEAQVKQVTINFNVSEGQVSDLKEQL